MLKIDKKQMWPFYNKVVAFTDISSFLTQNSDFRTCGAYRC